MHIFFIAMLLVVVCLIDSIFIRYFIKMLYSSGLQACFASNYHGKRIPCIGGAVFLPLLLVSLVLFEAYFPESLHSFLEFTFLAAVIGFTGILDDLAGNEQVKGILQHLRSTVEGDLTTGFLKAFMTGLAALLVSLSMSRSLPDMLLNLFLLLLFTNLLNLLDLRPGRAIKSFFVFFLPLIYLIVFHGMLTFLPLISMLLISLLYLRYDLREVCMLGDSGSNLLGVSLGYYYALWAPIPLKAVLLVFLISIHIVSERISLSAIFERSSLLSYFDNLGRSAAADDEYQPRRC